MPSPLSIVSDCIRGMIVAADGYDLITADFEQIEARTVAWLAGQQDVLDVFASGRDIYKHTASGICGTPYDAIDGTWRQIGKVSVLALGYQGGVGAFLKMQAGYGLKIGEHYDVVWGRSAGWVQEKVEDAWENRGRTSGVAKRSWYAAEAVKVAWRAANPKIAGLWPALEEAAIGAMLRPGDVVECGFVRYRKRGSFLFCQLPSGRCLTYAYPRLTQAPLPWGGTRQAIVFKAVDSLTKQWGDKAFYGGLASENITQAVARDLMAEGMVRVERAGYPVVLTVHDEIVCEAPKGFGDLAEFEGLMAETPAWAAGLPVTAKGWRGRRYRKG